MTTQPNPLTCAWGIIPLPSEPDYGIVDARYGKAGLFKTNQTVEDVSYHRMHGFVAVLCDDGSALAREVMHSLNLLNCPAVCPSCFDRIFPAAYDDFPQKDAFLRTMLDEAAELLVVPFTNWRADLVIWQEVTNALRVNTRVSVLTDRTLS
ncbi:hypothetical protein [Sulfitobacter sp. M22]|uniref:hypothetical protein n=1 Tax=Sulfitobacter sp. M22 TaxID=2675332 RepID=UPI001F28E484|nr:hypothetical protein [Sulfitobacter sp. M22]MCF7725759.1 hypothetical protein [Sulfitobacter sp. M22]